MKEERLFFWQVQNALAKSKMRSVFTQLDETFSVVLGSHSTPPSRLGSRREVNVTVRRNDDPYGVIQFGRSGATMAVSESKGNETYQGSLQ